MIKGKQVLLLIVVLCCLFANCPVSFAQEIGSIAILEEIPLPQDFNFTVSETCTGHAYFMQAAAD